MTYSSSLSSSLPKEKIIQEHKLSELVMIPLSVIILAKNEEQFIERCIRSVLWADEKLVLDSGSIDKTKEIAASLGANVYEQEWLGWSGQRKKAISLAKNDWVFILEADEIVTPELAQSIKTALSGPVDGLNGYSVNRRGDFYGILLPNYSPPWRRLNFVRLFNRRYSSYDPTMKIHEEVRFPGKTISLQGDLIHWRSFTMDEYINSANRNATLEAEMLDDNGYSINAIKIFLRPLLRFLWYYVIRFGFLLGTRGLIHAMWKANAEFVRCAKLWEMQKATLTPHPPADIYKDPTATS